jgi:FdhE protein
MTSAAAAPLRALRSAHPEWSPWLAVIDAVTVESARSHWEEFVPEPVSSERTPRIAGASIKLPKELLCGWLNRLTRTAAAAGTEAMASLRSFDKSAFEPLEIFSAALGQSTWRLAELARRCGADPRALAAVTQLVPVPFLHACTRAWASANATWNESYCYSCGAWPVFAEVRGIEKARYLRCARCGAEWQSHGLQCIFCGTDDHRDLESLVPQSAEATRTIECCKRCRSYLKAFTLLQGIDRIEIMLHDLASVDLDIAAVEQGYRPPDGLGYAVEARLEYAPAAARRFLPWSRQ